MGSNHEEYSNDITLENLKLKLRIFAEKVTKEFWLE